MYLVELSDRRNIILSEKLKAKPFAFNVAQAPAQGLVIVFSPAKKLSDIEANLLPKCATVLGGAQGGAVLEALNKKGVTYKNLMNDEEFVLENAVLTAEGALSLLIESTEKSIFDCEILITGYGRVAKALEALFKRLGLKTTFCVFKDKPFDTDRVYAASSINFGKYDAVINTIPAPVLSPEYLKKISLNAAIIELASVPCIKSENIKNYPLKYIKGSGLPAKYCPAAAAEAMYKCIFRLGLGA